MAGSEVPAIDGPAGQGRNQEAADRAVVVLRSDWRDRGRDRRPKRPGGQPRASSLAAFEPSLHLVDVVHALDDDAAGVEGWFILEGAETGTDVDAPFDGYLDGLRVHVVGSVAASVGSGGGTSLRDAIRRPASGQPLPPAGEGRTPGAHRDRYP